MTPSARPERLRVAVFARAPVPGEVKTRLAPLLGFDGAAGLHAGLVRQALSVAVGAGVGEVELWCTPDTRHEFFARCARDSGARLREQRGADLGERMRAAAEDAHADGAAVLLIGSDCPALTPAHLREAAHALATHDAVLVPAEDGGYVLAGLARALPAMFAGVSWGTSAVLRETRARLEGCGATWRELAPLWDVDRPEDYARLGREGLLAEVLS